MPTDGRPQVAVRVDPETIRELDELAAQASTPLASVSRSDVLRRAIVLGMEQIRTELNEPKAMRNYLTWLADRMAETDERYSCPPDILSLDIRSFVRTLSSDPEAMVAYWSEDGVLTKEYEKQEAEKRRWSELDAELAASCVSDENH